MKGELTVMGPEQLRALGHPLRLRVLDVLTDGEELTNRELAQRLGVDPGHLHFHVRLLMRAGLIERCEARGSREKPYRAVASSIRVGPDLGLAVLASDDQASLLASVERAWGAHAALGRFESAQVTARITPKQLTEVVRELTQKVTALEEGSADPLVITLFAHPRAG